jgi:hypothetical protein
MLKIVKLFFIIIIASSLCACTPRRLVVTEMVSVIETGIYAFERDDDLAMLEAAFPSNIKLLEIFLANDPENFRILVLLSRLYASYTFAFIESRLEKLYLKMELTETDTAEITFLKNTLDRYYRKGADYALKAIELRYPDCRKQLGNVSTVDAFLNSLDRIDVAALFWYGFNLAAYVNHNRDSVQAISKAFLVEKAMKRVVALDAAYFHGGAHLILIAYYASRSPAMGGNPSLALQHYHRLKSLTGEGFLLAQLYYARYYLYQMQRRSEYVHVLTNIVQYSTTDKTYQLYNKIATERAKTYLSGVDQFFEQ